MSEALSQIDRIHLNKEIPVKEQSKAKQSKGAMFDLKVFFSKNFFEGIFVLIQASLILAVFIGSLAYILLILRDTYHSTGSWIYQSEKTKQFGRKVFYVVIFVAVIDFMISFFRIRP
jgi:hypothetical protein